MLRVGTAAELGLPIAGKSIKLTDGYRLRGANTRDHVMPIRVKCEKCKKTLSVKDHLAGKKIKCPVCQSVVGVPLASPTKEAPAGTKTGAPKAAPAVPTAAKKSAAATKPVAKAKPKPDTNGVAPPAKGTNGTNGKAPPPAPIELPPENVEEEALAALADQPPPPEETQAPKTIDFKCQWCDEDVKLPIEMAGKQAQCPNSECKRIIKVPLPKTPEKKDWRKMERAGPAAAKINLPEALDNAWGTEEATRARQDSLAQAGAVEAPPKPPLGVFGWMRRGFYAVGIAALVSVVAFGGFKLLKSNEEFNALKDIKLLLDGRQPKIIESVLKAEAERTKGLYHLHGRDPKVILARKDFDAARSYVIKEIGDVPPPLDKPLLHEQFFLIELALSQIESSGKEDDVLTKKRQEWEKTRTDLDRTLKAIKTEEIQVIALREVAARLDQQVDLKDRRAMAIGLAGGLSAQVGDKRPLAFRQQIALVFWQDDKKLDGVGVKEPELKDLEKLEDGHLRVGFAEGYARKGNFDEAFKLAKFPGPDEDRLDAFLGIAAVALDAHKEKSAEALKAALEIAKDPKNDPTRWQWLELVRLGARLDDVTAVKEALDRLPAPVANATSPFKLRAHLQVFLAKCSKATTPISTDELKDLFEDDEKECITLALAWMALARQHARTGNAGRKENLKTFEDYEKRTSAPLNFDLMRPMVVIGTYQRLK